MHGANYWDARRDLVADRTRLRDGVRDRQHVRVRFELSERLGIRSGAGPEQPRRDDPHRRPSRSARLRAEGAGPYGSPRFPWTVGNALTVNGSNQPIFVDPIENVVTVQLNTVETIATDGTVTPASGLSGQVYAAIVNGVAVPPTIATETYNNGPYYPFNLDNLDVSAAPTANSDTYSNAHADTDSNADADTDSNAHADTDSDAHADTDSNAHADTHSDTDASTSRGSVELASRPGGTQSGRCLVERLAGRIELHCREEPRRRYLVGGRDRYHDDVVCGLGSQLFDDLLLSGSRVSSAACRLRVRL